MPLLSTSWTPLLVVVQHTRSYSNRSSHGTSALSIEVSTIYVNLDRKRLRLTIPTISAIGKTVVMLTFSDFRVWEKLIDPNPPVPLQTPWAWIAFFVLLMLCAGVVGRLWRGTLLRSLRALRVSLFNLFLTTGIVGLVYTFLRLQGIPYFSARVLLAAVLLGALIWGSVSAIRVLRTLPSERKALAAKQIFEAYLPKPKKRSKDPRLHKK